MNRGTPSDVLAYWFGDASHDPVLAKQKSKLWYGSNLKVDQFIRDQFGELMALAEADELQDWASSAMGSLALVVLLDQFSRNIYRRSSNAYKNDPRAIIIAANCINNNQHLSLSPIERAFLYHPFQHAESQVLQDQSVRLFTALETFVKNRHDAWLPQISSFANHARRSRETVMKFGRYPHRNKVLARQNTPAEEEYLNRDRRQFGQ